MAGKIFISYRREDEQGFAVRLYERLSEHYGNEEIFFDIDSIPPGFDFVEYIEKQIELCEVVLVVIGNNWLNAVDPQGRRRLENPNDFVRVEIELALKQGKHVVPILVQGTPMPLSKELPRKMQSLSRRNAFFATHVGFRNEVNRLISGIESAFPHIEARQSPDPQPPRKRKALARSNQVIEHVEASETSLALIESVESDVSSDELLAGELAISLAESLADFEGTTVRPTESGRQSTIDTEKKVEDGIRTKAEENRVNEDRLESPVANRPVTYYSFNNTTASTTSNIGRIWLYGIISFFTIAIIIAFILSTINDYRKNERINARFNAELELPGSGIFIGDTHDSSSFGRKGRGVLVSKVGEGLGARSVGIKAGWLISRIGSASVNSSENALREYKNLVSSAMGRITITFQKPNRLGSAVVSVPIEPG